MDLLRELYHVLLAVAFFVSSTLGAKDKELYCGGKFYMPTIMNFRLQLTPGGGSHMKQTGMLVGNFEFNP